MYQSRDVAGIHKVLYASIYTPPYILSSFQFFDIYLFFFSNCITRKKKKILGFPVPNSSWVVNGNPLSLVLIPWLTYGLEIGPHCLSATKWLLFKKITFFIISIVHINISQYAAYLRLLSLYQIYLKIKSALPWKYLKKVRIQTNMNLPPSLKVLWQGPWAESLLRNPNDSFLDVIGDQKKETHCLEDWEMCLVKSGTEVYIQFLFFDFYY